ncbi:MAG: 2-C-methyl-D-erythritol 4-phosphate cytidylyltransferase [Bacteroidales bacterium]
MQRTIIIVAGGAGSRMGSKIPKQFLELNGKPVLMHTLEKFYSFDDTIEIILVLPLDQVPQWDKLCIHHNFKIKHLVAFGGETRYHSVKSGMAMAIPGSVVGIHDGVRPLVSMATIRRCFETAEMEGNAIPAVTSTESVRYTKNGQNHFVARQDIKLIQTPQVFQWNQVQNAYDQEFKDKFTDDASVVESMGFPVNLVAGNPENIKITTPLDMKLAEAILDF